jgi:hypothetical protein
VGVRVVVVVYLLLYIEQYLWVWDDDDDVLNLFTVYVPGRTHAVEKLMFLMSCQFFESAPVLFLLSISLFTFSRFLVLM